jgi:hypothetical protein
MRRADEHQLLQGLEPVVPGQPRMVAGTACHEAAHAVADDHEFADRLRPVTDQRLEQLGEGLSVRSDMPAGVVAQIERCVAELVGQRGAVVVTFASPLPVVQAQAVHQHQQLARRARITLCIERR